MPSRSFPALLGLSLAVTLAAPRARAALGEAEGSVAADRQALQATARGRTARAGFTVHELATGGATVREYVSADGRVFAVAWSGLSQPTLEPLLGAYAAEYRAAAGAAPRVRGRRAQQVAGASVVVERWGHMRELHGRAYLPALLPDGVTVDALE
jgi:hypothetical protein